MKAGLFNPNFVYIPAAAHESDPEAFRRRMRRRRREMQAPAVESSANVRPLPAGKKQAKA